MLRLAQRTLDEVSFAKAHESVSVQLVDTHAHLDDEQFAGQVDAIVQRAMDAGVARMIAVGTTAESSAAVVRLARRYSLVQAAVGIQPNYCAGMRDDDWARIVALADDPSVVAIGETGLDWHWEYTPLDLQRELFERHVSLSQATGLPFVVHLRETGDAGIGLRPDNPSSHSSPTSCAEDILRRIRAASRVGPIRGVMHSYTGSAAFAHAFVELGMHISFAGMVTFKKSAELRSVAAEIPADRLLIETDAPYLTPEPVRKQRPNEPALVVHTARCLAEVRGVSLAELARQTTENALRLFTRNAR